MTPLRRLTPIPNLAFALAMVPFLALGARSQQPTLPATAQPIEATGAAQSMDSLLQARKSVEKFFEQSANVVCAESITQTVMGKNGKASYREESKYEYQLTASSANGSLKMSESREARKLPFRDPSRTLMVTNGFTNLLLVLHPDYEASYQFEPAGEEAVDGVLLEKFLYKPIPGGLSPAALRVRGKSYSLPLSGTVWIDKRSNAITRITATVDRSLADLGLQGMSSDIHYSLVQFHDPDETYWMPVSATVDLETAMQHWRNVHRFTSYRRFRATIQIETGKSQ